MVPAAPCLRRQPASAAMTSAVPLTDGRFVTRRRNEQVVGRHRRSPQSPGACLRGFEGSRRHSVGGLRRASGRARTPRHCNDHAREREPPERVCHVGVTSLVKLARPGRVGSLRVTLSSHGAVTGRSRTVYPLEGDQDRSRTALCCLSLRGGFAQHVDRRRQKKRGDRETHDDVWPAGVQQPDGGACP